MAASVSSAVDARQRTMRLANRIVTGEAWLRRMPATSKISYVPSNAPLAALSSSRALVIESIIE